MFKKILSHAIPTLMLALLFSNPGFVASPGDTTNPVSPQQRALHQDNHLPAGLTAGDWRQIRALIEQENHRAVLSPQGIFFTTQQAYLKASNTNGNDFFGIQVAVSGNTVVVGAPNEDSNATGVDGNENNNLASNAGAAYVFVRSGGSWIRQAYLKASNTDAGDYFGRSVAVSGDTIVVGAPDEDSNATGVNGNQNNDSLASSGAAYVFVRSFTRIGPRWKQQAYLKASNPDFEDEFGHSVAVSGDTVVVGAFGEDSSATGVNGDQNDDSLGCSGAAYVFVRSGTS